MFLLMSYKQAIIIRTDLGMQKGKIASQASHASVSASYKVLKKFPKVFDEWFNSMAKIVLKVDNLQDLMNLKNKAARAGLITALIKDAGHTQIPPGTITSLAIGPDEEKKIDQIIKGLKLL